MIVLYLIIAVLVIVALKSGSMLHQLSQDTNASIVREHLQSTSNGSQTTAEALAMIVMVSQYVRKILISYNPWSE